MSIMRRGENDNMKRTNVLKIVLVIVQINEYNKIDVKEVWYGLFNNH